MARRCLLLVLIVVLYHGCSSDTITPGGGVFDTDLSFSRTATPSLTGGGRFFGQKDTGVWYDAAFSYSVKNTSTTDHSFSYRLEVGLFKDGHFQNGGGTIAFDPDSVFAGTVVTPIYNKSTGTLTIVKTIGLGRRNNDWSIPYGYRLTIKDIQSGDSTSFEGLFDGSTIDNRYHGIIYTTEQSSDPQGLFDGPDDGDWQSNGDLLKASPVYPNPCSGSTTLQMEIAEAGKIVYSINRTASDVVWRDSVDAAPAGTHEIELSFASVPAGTYRIFITTSAGSKTAAAYGDVRNDKF